MNFTRHKLWNLYKRSSLLGFMLTDVFSFSCLFIAIMRKHSLLSVAFATVTAVILVIAPTTCGAPVAAEEVALQDERQHYGLGPVSQRSELGKLTVRRLRNNDDEQDGDKPSGRGKGGRVNKGGDDRHYYDEDDEEEDEQDDDLRSPSRMSGGRPHHLLDTADEAAGSLPLAAGDIGGQEASLDSVVDTTIDGKLIPGSHRIGRLPKGHHVEA
ncbi:hypothetical protein BX666DRAFT_1959694 [Dichotomocladium elegans]|nr:hypothetical protein BX666DRAFT_1959694 [Dichotomocladium elegans]